MKHFYFTIALIFAINTTYAQDPNLLGTWFLHSINQNGMTPVTTAPDNYTLTIEADTFNPNNDFIARGDMRCNAYQSDSSFPTASVISLANNSVTLAQCGGEENLYIGILYNNSNQINHTYQITGSGNDALLTLTNSTNDVLLYGKQTLSINTYTRNYNFKLKSTIVENTLEIIVNNYKNISYSLINLDGKLITKNTKLLSDNKIDISYLNAGLYFLNIIDKKNNRQILKFIKK